MTAASKFAPTKFHDLVDKKVVVIHAGQFAHHNSESRQIWQRAHNLAISETNPIDPEQEPEQSLFVSEEQCAKGGRFFKMAALLHNSKAGQQSLRRRFRSVDLLSYRHT